MKSVRACVQLVHSINDMEERPKRPETVQNLQTKMQKKSAPTPANTGPESSRRFSVAPIEGWADRCSRPKRRALIGLHWEILPPLVPAKWYSKASVGSAEFVTFYFRPSTVKKTTLLVRPHDGSDVHFHILLN
jgi:hypothetical protein